MEIIEVDIEDKKRKIHSSVANKCMQAAFNRQGSARYRAEEHKSF